MNKDIRDEILQELYELSKNIDVISEKDGTIGADEICKFFDSKQEKQK